MRALSRQVESNANSMLVRGALAANQAIVLATPVDTGRARANWQANVGSALTGALTDIDRSGGDTISRNARKISGRRPGSGQEIHITNNVDYINQLNQGSSAQAPAGFVETAVMVALNAIRAGRILRRG